MRHFTPEEVAAVRIKQPGECAILELEINGEHCVLIAVPITKRNLKRTFCHTSPPAQEPPL